ncbi:hypothetical protein [Achromobacter mucicolens]|uniref:hypothetical protein n=1 Tax=Achromobacter mucicolens TaxID=1389922 RepID=UPI001CC120FE|nr:hypothetical protein [Achromobacter mucicolens]UAN03037.1 hypothetical protein K9D24_02320 [Achromobacter mucicolens]
MNTMSTSAPPVRHRHPITIKRAIRKLGDLLAPRDHAGKGNWNKNADIPLWAWPASLGFAAFFLFGPKILAWLLRLPS